jgi:hypothetical protein
LASRNIDAKPQAPKKASKDVFHAWMAIGDKFDECYDMPIISKTNTIPKKLVSFSEAVRFKKLYPGTWIHFYEHDVNFERFWNNPLRYLDILKQATGVVSPDYSVCMDFPEPVRRFNCYRNFLCGAWTQLQEVDVIPNIRIFGYQSVGYALAGAPSGGTIAIGAHGYVKNHHERKKLIEEVSVIVDILKPATIVVYGSDAYNIFDYPRGLGIDVIFFESQTSHAHKDACCG